MIQLKRIIRTMCNSSRLEHTMPLFSDLTLFKFQDILYKFLMGVHMQNVLAAGSFETSHNVNTRNNNLAAPLFMEFQTHLWNYGMDPNYGIGRHFI